MQVTYNASFKASIHDMNSHTILQAAIPQSAPAHFFPMALTLVTTTESQQAFLDFKNTRFFTRCTIQRSFTQTLY